MALKLYFQRKIINSSTDRMDCHWLDYKLLIFFCEFSLVICYFFTFVGNRDFQPFGPCGCEKANQNDQVENWARTKIHRERGESANGDESDGHLVWWEASPSRWIRNFVFILILGKRKERIYVPYYYIKYVIILYMLMLVHMWKWHSFLFDV